MEEIDAFISSPFNVEDVNCEDEYTKKKIIKMVKFSNIDRDYSLVTNLIKNLSFTWKFVLFVAKIYHL
jgi:hypothetical protein